MLNELASVGADNSFGELPPIYKSFTLVQAKALEVAILYLGTQALRVHNYTVLYTFKIYRSAEWHSA